MTDTGLNETMLERLHKAAQAREGLQLTSLQQFFEKHEK